MSESEGTTAVAEPNADKGGGKEQASKPAKKKSAKKPTLKVTSGKEVGSTLLLPLSAFVRMDTPRHEPTNLYDLGYVLCGTHPTWQPPEVKEGEKPEERKSLRDMALGGMDEAREFVALIEKYESIDRSKHPDAPQSITELAADILKYDQLLPAVAKKDKNGWLLTDGGRRATAILYLHAKGRVNKADKLEGHKSFEPNINVIESNTKDDFDIALILNLSRKQFTPLQEGRIYHEMLSMKNPETKKDYTLKEVAARVGVKYGTVRHREALWRPFKAAQKDGRGQVVKKRTGLTDDERQRVAMGELGATEAARRSLAEEHGSPREVKRSKRRTPLTLTEIEKLFDETPERNTERRKALAECMGITVAQADKESDARIQQAEQRELKQNAKKNKKKGKAA